MKALLLLPFLIFPALAQDTGIAAVWAVNDGEKIARDDLSNPNKSTNSAWDGASVQLVAARNEVVAFQLIVESNDKGIDALSVSLPSLTHSSGRPAIVYQAPGDDPTRSLARPIQLFTENYMNIPAPGNASWIYEPGSASAPANIVGWKPVQLVPENARAGRGGFPVKVAARQNQAFWIEIYTRKDLAAGIYQGEVQVKAAGAVVIRVPVKLELLSFALPDRNSIQAMFYYEGDQPELYQGRNLDDVYHRFAHRNRVEFVNAYTQADAVSARGRFDGSAFTAANGYEGPGAGVGNLILPNTFYDPGNAFDNRQSAWTTADAWMTFLGGFLPSAITFVYMPDEPSSSEYPLIRTISDNIKSDPKLGRNLPIFITKEWVPELDGAIDIWCAAPSTYQISRAATERQKGHRYWTYNGGRPFAPAIVIEAPATDPRAMIWSCFKHGIDGYFYWHTDHWLHNSQKPNNRLQNVWGNPITYDNRISPGAAGDFAYGDGVLMYPGTDVQFPDQDRGIDGPVSTVQMANFRRGIQDHLYLTMARSLHLDATVDELLGALVTRVFSDTTEAAPAAFAQTGNAFEAARQRLGREISAKLTPPSLPDAGIVNGASYAAALAPGAIVSLFGTSLAGSTEPARTVPLPLQLSNVQLLVNGVAAPLFYASPFQINAQLPFDVPAGPAELEVISTSGTATATAVIAASGPGIFARNAQGTGPGSILHGISMQPVTDSDPAHVGEIISIYCTGLGAVNPALPAGAAAPVPTPVVVVTPDVTIGGRPADVQFAGLAPGFVGLYQVNAVIPVGTQPGAQDVVISLGGVIGNTVTVAVK